MGDAQSTVYDENEGKDLWWGRLSVSPLSDGTIKNLRVLKSGMIRVTWWIEGFGSTHFRNRELVKSPQFSTEPLCDADWQLYFYPNGVDGRFRNNLSIALGTRYNTGRMRSVDVCFSLLDKNDVNRKKRFYTIELRNTQINFCWCERFVYRPVVFGQRDELFHDDTLTIVCYLYNFEPETNALPKAREAAQGKTLAKAVKFTSKSVYSQANLYSESAYSQAVKLACKSVYSQTNLYSESADSQAVRSAYKSTDLKAASFSDESADSHVKSHGNSLMKLSQDMAALLKDANTWDVTLRAEGRHLSAHKLMLSARSIIFHSMFEYPRKELDSIVEIADIKFDCLERFITYLYSGNPGELTIESAFSLLAAADKYAVQDLSEICTGYIQDHLDIENSLQVLLFADLHSVTELKEVALAFVCLHFKEVSAKQDWRNELKERPHLAAELLFSMTV